MAEHETVRCPWCLREIEDHSIGVIRHLQECRLRIFQRLAELPAPHEVQEWIKSRIEQESNFGD